MGLAASQARFLCITARKTNCEYKSTDLAQQKLEITNQLADISNTYSNAMNSTKLMWDNENCDSATSLSYGLLMTPSAANDYNPYMLSTTAGAIVLNSEYAAAAKAAGISKAGGSLGSQDSRDKFISALAYGGALTEETAKQITVTDYTVDEAATKEAGAIQFNSAPVSDTNSLVWDTLAGVGGIPKDKYAADTFTLSELCMSDIGQTTVDWAQSFTKEVTINGQKQMQITQQEYDEQRETYNDLIKSVQQDKITKQVLSQLETDYNTEKNNSGTNTDKYKTLWTLAQQINNDTDDSGHLLDASGNLLDASALGGSYSATSGITKAQLRNEIIKHFQDDKTAYETKYSTAGAKVSLTDANSIINTETTKLDKKTGKANNKLSVLSNGIVQTGDAVSEITISDVLTGNITLISGESGMTKNQFCEYVTKIFDSIVAQLGYTNDSTVTNVGLNVDETSVEALSFAYKMVMKQNLNPNKAVNVGSDSNQSSMMDNKAYVNAENNNAIGGNGGGDASKSKNWAVSLSNMLSAFLTYYDNGLYGADSSYVVGQSVDTSDYVTEDSGYAYLGKLTDPDAEMSMSEKVSDFYDSLYNNIIEHGWREDSSIDDSEYMEQCIKNGTYSMTSLNQKDGYYYQSRYNDTGYINEVSDEDAIARAEAEFTAKKAELTYKEDKIDIQTKQLDAEISSLSTEYETVKQLISKSIEKTFAMFSN